MEEEEIGFQKERGHGCTFRGHDRGIWVIQYKSKRKQGTAGLNGSRKKGAVFLPPH